MRRDNEQLNSKEKRFIRNHISGMSDEEIAAERGLDVGLVRAYRRNELGISRWNEPTRRQLLFLAGAGVLGAAGLSFGGLELYQKMTEPRYKRLERRLSSDEELFLREMILLEPIESSFYNEGEAQSVSDHVKSSPRFSAGRHTAVEVFEQAIVIPETDIDYVDRYITEITPSIDFALNYWDHPGLVKPRINFEVPNNVQAFSKRMRDDDDLTILLVHDAGMGRFARIDYHDGDEPELKEIHQAATTGFSSNRYSIDIKPGRLENSRISSIPLILALNNSPKTLIPVVAEEVLHDQINKYDLTGLVEEGNELLEQGELFSGNVFTYLFPKYKTRIEAFVHGLGLNRFRKENKALGWGFSEEDIMKHYSGALYVGLFEMADRLKGIPPAEAIDMYINNDPKLWEDTGL